MVNKVLFDSDRKKQNKTNTLNEAGGTAYSLSAEELLAKYSVTGCFNNNYYTSDKSQLSKIIEICDQLELEYIAKVAIYSKQNGFMKDIPAVLLAYIASKDTALLSKTFNKVIDNPKILRNFIKVIRSGIFGRKSLGTRPKKLIQNYLESMTDEQLFRADIGNDPSLPDIIKMVHPKPKSKSRSALYAYLIGKPYHYDDLCDTVKDFESFKKLKSQNVPNVPFQMLISLPLTDNDWSYIIKNMTWNQLRLNLNSLYKRNVFSNEDNVKYISDRISNKNEILKSKVFPYQIYSAYINLNTNIPKEISSALEAAVQICLQNIPNYNKKIFVMVDVSGSMSSPVTGYKGGSSSKIRFVDVASLFASAILNKNKDTEIIPFDTHVIFDSKINSNQSVMKNAKILANYGGGGTCCEVALKHLNKNNLNADIIIYISDNQSNSSFSNFYDSSSETPTMIEWFKFKKNNPEAKLINIDIAPYMTEQTKPLKDILNISGFNDHVFDVINSFISSESNKNLVNKINDIII